jgi:hypothetical protein
MSHNVRSWFDIAGNCYGPRIVVRDELVSAPEPGFRKISRLVNLKEVDVVHRRVFGGQISHVLYNGNQQSF